MPSTPSTCTTTRGEQAVPREWPTRSVEGEFLDERQHDSRSPRGRFKFTDGYEFAEGLALIGMKGARE